MKKKLPIILSTATLAGAAILGLALKIHAQETVRTITIVPPAVEQNVNPGDIREGKLKVVNDGNEPLTFNATIRDYVVEDNHGTPLILPPNTLSNKYSGAAWVGVTPYSFTVPPHQRQELNYYLQVPLDAKPGGHYAAVVYEPTKTLGVEGTGTGVNTQIGTLFYFNVAGQITEQASVIKFFTKAFQEYGPIKITTEILNNGDLHIKPRGSIVLKNMLGQKVEEKALEEHNIFPARSLVFENVFGKKFMMGKYTAQLLATYGKNNNQTLTALVTFYVFPWKAATVTLLVLIIIILLALLFTKRKKNRKHPEVSPEA